MSLDSETFAQQLHNANQSIVKEGLRVARNEGRAAGPDMFAPEHSEYDAIPGVEGAKLYVRRDKHPGMSGIPMRGIKDGEYGG